mgnify:CR=1 FL=1
MTWDLRDLVFTNVYCLELPCFEFLLSKCLIRFLTLFSDFSPILYLIYHSPIELVIIFYFNQYSIIHLVLDPVPIYISIPLIFLSIPSDYHTQAKPLSFSILSIPMMSQVNWFIIRLMSLITRCSTCFMWSIIYLFIIAITLLTLTFLIALDSVLFGFSIKLITIVSLQSFISKQSAAMFSTRFLSHIGRDPCS